MSLLSTPNSEINVLLKKRNDNMKVSNMLYTAAFLKTKPEVYLGNTSNKNIQVYDYETKQTTSINNINTTIYAIAVSGNDKLVVTSGTGNQIFVICTTKRKMIHKFNNIDSSIYGLQFASDNRSFFSVDSISLKKWDVKTKKLNFSIIGMKVGEKQSLVLSKDNKKIYGCLKQHAGVVDLKRGYRISFLNKSTSIRCNELSSDEGIFLTGSRGGHLTIINIKNRKKLKKERPFKSDITCMRRYKEVCFIAFYNGEMIAKTMSYPFTTVYTYEMKMNTFGFSIHTENKLMVSGGQDGSKTKLFDIQYINIGSRVK